MRSLTLGLLTVILLSASAFAADEWLATKEIGAASGKRQCFISSPSIDVSVMISFYPDNGVLRSVVLGNEIEPGSWSYLAIAGKRFKTDAGGFMGSEAEEIMRLLAQHETVAFEWDEWPTGKTHSGEIPTANVASLIAECETWVLQS